MLPDWDFNGEEAKRRAFVEWVVAELDRWAAFTTERFVLREPPRAGWLDASRAAVHAPRPVGRPSKPDADRANDGMDAALWDYILLKHMFGRYWPGRSRPINDPAHPAQIAVRRNRHELRHVLDYSTWGEDADETAKAEAVHAQWKKWKDQPGKRMGDDDLAYLRSLPDYFFAR